jgi:hypothetical protein
MPPTGTQLVAAPTQLVVKGITGDGKYAFYVDPNAQTLNAVPVAGGRTATLGPYKIGNLTPTRTGAVFFSTIASMTSIGSLWVWSPAAGSTATALSMSANAAAGVDMSPDGSLVAYFATTSADGNTATLTVSTIDGKTQTPLVTGVDLTLCPGDVQFVQPSPSAPLVLVAGYCLAADADAGAGGGLGEPENLATFTGTGFTKTILGTFDSMKFPFALPVDPGGTQLLLTGPSGLALYPIAGGAPKIVDPNGTGDYAIFATNGGDIVYTTTSGAVSRYSSATATSKVLIANGTYTPIYVTLDGNWIQLAQNVNQSTGTTDVDIASATAAGSPTRVWSMTNATPSGFTGDSGFELFLTSNASFQNVTADLYASPVSGGAPGKVATIAGAAALAGSKLALAVNYAAGLADIEVVDLANPTAMKTLVTQADPNIQVTPTNQIVYSWYCQPDSMAGVWVAPPQ